MLISLVATLAAAAPCQMETPDTASDAATALAALPPPETLYAVVVSTCASQAHADSERDAWSARGYAPVSVVQAAGGWEVCVGLFDLYADAYIYRTQFREQDPESEAHVTTLANTQRARTTENAGPLRPVFSLEVPHVTQMAERASAPTRLRSELETLVQSQGDRAAVRERLRSALGECSESDPTRGYILTRLGMMDLADGSLDGALESFRAVANHEVPSDPVSRIKAMNRVAWILHQRGDRLQALQAYEEIGRFTGSDFVRAQCAVEETGLIMELARSEKGSMADCRRMASRALAVIPTGDDPDYVQMRSTVELMVLETYHHEGNYEHSIELGEAFVERYLRVNPVPWREVGQAMFLNGHNEHLLGNNEAAIQWFNRTLREVPPDTEFFAGENPLAKSLADVAEIQVELGHTDEVIEIYRRLINEFPGENISRAARAAYPTLAE